ncbi:serine/threonine protein kinase [Thermobifida alba]|uniref:Serine/threonine protein kinase n=1 Tax=Thermobifida alba TaxID=53522 RepID=A0ABY4L848_THEAE|nr:serine/threonine protein kinase [Thermobifida alba]
MEPLLPGDPERVGPYRLVGRLGAGGMGQVFLARSPGGRPVVVKVILPEYASDTEYRARFAREVEAARRVGGFHTAQVVAADPDADPPWMATAYVPGPSLSQAVHQRGPLDEQVLRTLAAGLAEGLAAIHGCGLVHRDFKPGNIILAADGPRIIDFGIARPTDASTMTQTGAVIGTLSYMSPEQIGGSPVGPASDIFSFGTVLAFAATGRSPFAADTLGAIVMRIVSPPPELPELPPDLRELVRACWVQHPDGRPTAADLLDRLSDRAGGEWPPPHLADLAETALPAGSTAPLGPDEAESPESTPDRETGRNGSAGRAATPRQPTENTAQETGQAQGEEKMPWWAWVGPVLVAALILPGMWLASLPATPDLFLPGTERSPGVPLVTDIEERVRGGVQPGRLQAGRRRRGHSGVGLRERGLPALPRLGRGRRLRPGLRVGVQPGWDRAGRRLHRRRSPVVGHGERGAGGHPDRPGPVRYVRVRDHLGDVRRGRGRGDRCREGRRGAEVGCRDREAALRCRPLRSRAHGVHPGVSGGAASGRGRVGHRVRPRARAAVGHGERGERRHLRGIGCQPLGRRPGVQRGRLRAGQRW